MKKTTAANTPCFLDEMTAYISLGSNLGDRLKNLESATQEITKLGFSILKISSVYETPALLLPKASLGWNRPFLNGVVKIQCNKTDPKQLLYSLKMIEKYLGRKKSFKWAPRIIDLDILLFGQEIINTVELKIPHPELVNRNFILAPLKEMNPSLKVPGNKRGNTVLELFRHLQIKIPTWMHILNVTPDSFSDGGKLNLNNFKAILQKISEQHIHIVDLGAESTRPGAVPVSPKEEWQRLKPYIEMFFNFYKNKIFRPKLSVDTRYSQTAKQVVDMGVDIINDVSGLSDEMLELLKDTDVEYILMHSVTVPASRKEILSVNEDPVDEIKKWLNKKINILEKHSISLDRVIFDPGLGFGKNADQCMEILKRINEFYCFPLRILVGHSRKSFMNMFSSDNPAERDSESAGVSCALVEKGVDILRVHEADFHNRFLRGYQEVKSV